MRITRENLVRIAKETAQKRALSEPELVAAYLTGSLRTPDPFLGNTTDIDIVLVHESQPRVLREIVPLTPEIHLDIVHHPRSDYEKPKALRIHPWLGPELYDPLPLFGTQHFFEFIQAGVRDKFNEPESTLLRSRTLAENARQMWSDLQLKPADGPDWLLSYLTCLQLAANGVSLLGDALLSERRLLLEFPARADAAGLPELVSDLYQLSGAGRVDAATLAGFLPEWENAFVTAGTRPSADLRILTPRLRYYKLAFESMLAGDTPQAVLWPLLLTWTCSVSILSPTWIEHWQSACKMLGLEGTALEEKKEALDHFLDALEEALENRSAGQGI
jgi:hypothetical protein